MQNINYMIFPRELNEKSKWLINLRWIACIGVFTVITYTNFILNIKLPLLPLYIGNAVLGVYNCIFLVYNSYLESVKDAELWIIKANYFANIQISADLITLAFLIYFSGGIENPFMFYFVFHMVIASILLSGRAAYLQATLAMLILGIVVSGQYIGLFSHYHLNGFLNEKLYLNPDYVLGVFIVFSTTLYIIVYMTTSIVKDLRKKDAELTKANELLGEQDRLKSQYVLAVSHDLQSSLASVQSCLKVVVDNYTGKIPGKSKEMIVRAEQRTKSILNFVKDLLDLSKIRAEKIIERKMVSLNETIKKVLDDFKTVIKEKILNIKLEEAGNDLVIFTHRDGIEQVFSNLLDNAVKYTPVGGIISIRLKHAKLNNFMEVSIEDSGIGISREDIPHIFEDFYRAKNARTMEKDGTGLGLSIVKQIIDSHGGKIWAESQLGKGSKFTFILPVKYEREK